MSKQQVSPIRPPVASRRYIHIQLGCGYRKRVVGMNPSGIDQSSISLRRPVKSTDLGPIFRAIVLRQGSVNVINTSQILIKGQYTFIPCLELDYAFITIIRECYYYYLLHHLPSVLNNKMHSLTITVIYCDKNARGFAPPTSCLPFWTSSKRLGFPSIHL
jgi:hypothetical protein